MNVKISGYNVIAKCVHGPVMDKEFTVVKNHDTCGFGINPYFETPYLFSSLQSAENAIEEISKNEETQRIFFSYTIVPVLTKEVMKYRVTYVGYPVSYLVELKEHPSYYLLSRNIYKSTIFEKSEDAQNALNLFFNTELIDNHQYQRNNFKIETVKTQFLYKETT